MFTIEGAGARRSNGSMWRHPRNTPSRLTSITRRHGTNKNHASVVDESVETSVAALDLARGRRPGRLVGHIECKVKTGTARQVRTHGLAALTLDCRADRLPDRTERAGDNDSEVRFIMRHPL